MNKIRSIFYLLFILLLVGCTGTDQTVQEQNNSNQVSFTNISTKNKDIDQHISNQVKETLKDHKDIQSAHVVNSNKDIVIAVRVTNFDRFQLNDIEKKIKKKVKKEYPDKKVFVSTDQKIILEVEKMENKLQSTNITKKKLEKQMKEIIRLGKEQT